jgi:hypothetical protein
VAPAVELQASASRTSGRLALARFRSLTAHPRAQAGLAFLAYLALALFLTWPFAIRPSTTLFGSPAAIGSDLTSAVAFWRELAEAHQAPFLAGTVPDFNAPEGLATSWWIDFASFPSSTLLWLGSMAFGAVATHGLFALASFALSALSMFLLARWATGNVPGAFIAGLAFGFWPLQYSTATVPMGQTWVLVLLVWRMLVLVERPTLRNGVWAGLSAVLALWWTQYWLLIGGVVYASLLVAALVLAWRSGRLRAQVSAQLVGVAVVVVFLTALVLVEASAGFEGIPTRAAGENLSYSARPLMYVVPDPDNVLFGDRTWPFLHSKFPGASPDGSTAAYNDIYVGVSVILLALVGFAAVAHHWLRHGRAAASQRLPAVAAACTAIAFVALVFSAPPDVTLFGRTIPFPAHYVNEVTTAFRTTARFAAVVMLGLCVLAAVGVGVLLRGRSQRLQVAILIGLAIAVPLDLEGIASPSTVAITYPPIYERLKSEPPGILAEYPLDREKGGNSTTRFYQQAHGHPVFNGWSSGSESESLKTELHDLRDRHTVPALTLLGVSYVLVQNVPGDVPDYVEPGTRLRGLRLIAQDLRGALYRVVASPPTGLVLPVAGISPPEGAPPNVYRFVGYQDARLKVYGRCRVCAGELRFRARSFAQPRVLTLRYGDRRSARRSIPVNRSVTVTLPMRFRHETTVSLSTDPPPQSIAETIGAADPRSMSIHADRYRFVPYQRTVHR